MPTPIGGRLSFEHCRKLSAAKFGRPNAARRKLSNAQRAAMRAERAAGASLSQLGAVYGVHPNTVSKITRCAGAYARTG
jgi:hypothetical protein